MSPMYAAFLELQKVAFIALHNRDHHYDFSQNIDIPNMPENVLVCNLPENEKPWFINRCTLFLLEIFCFGWIQKFKMLKSTKQVEYRLHKYIYF